MRFMLLQMNRSGYEFFELYANMRIKMGAFTNTIAYSRTTGMHWDSYIGIRSICVYYDNELI